MDDELVHPVRESLSNTNPTVAGGLVVNNGKIEYAVMKDEYRDGLRYMHKLFEEGLLDNQTFLQDNTSSQLP